MKKSKKILLPPAKDIFWFRSRLFTWYRRSARIFPWRHETATIFDQILAEIFLQRTQAENASKFFQAFVKKYPSWEDIATLRRKKLERVLRPLGLWKRRASSLSLLAKELTRLGGKFPDSPEEIALLPGVGQYIGNAISVFFLGQTRSFA